VFQFSRRRVKALLNGHATALGFRSGVGPPARRYAVEFAILGRLAVRNASGDPVRVAGTRRRALLVRLLLAAPDGLSNERLAEDVWGATLDSVSPSTVRSHVCLLRRVLGGDRVLGNGDGYVLRFEPDELDAIVFDRERRAGHAALGRGDARGAVEHLDRALSL